MSGNAGESLTGVHELTFTWETENIDSAYNKDQVLMVAYNIAGEHVSYELNGQFRSVRKDILHLFQDYKPGTILYVYIAFIAADRSRQLESLYEDSRSDKQIVCKRSDGRSCTLFFRAT